MEENFFFALIQQRRSNVNKFVWFLIKNKKYNKFLNKHIHFKCRSFQYAHIDVRSYVHIRTYIGILWARYNSLMKKKTSKTNLKCQWRPFGRFFNKNLSPKGTKRWMKSNSKVWATHIKDKKQKVNKKSAFSYWRVKYNWDSLKGSHSEYFLSH